MQLCKDMVNNENNNRSYPILTEVPFSTTSGSLDEDRVSLFDQSAPVNSIFWQGTSM